MTRQEFKAFIDKKVIFLDGATGSNLQKKGMPAGVCPELWIIENPDALIELQTEYVEAGSNIVYAPTFGGNRVKLTEYGLADRVVEINSKLVEISKKAVGDKALVAADISMTGAQLEPMGDMTFDQLFEIYKEQISILVDAGVDLVTVETMMSLAETRAAVLAARAVSQDIPVIVTMSFAESGYTLYGASAESAMQVLAGLGVDAMGLNCSAGPDKMLPVVEKLYKNAPIPVIVKPNAGLPTIDAEGNTVYDMKADDFACLMIPVVETGAHIVGGCCGTAPDYIKALNDNVGGMIPEDNYYKAPVLVNEREVFEFEVDQELELGEGLDFNTDDDMREELEDELYDTAIDNAFDLMDDEVDALLFTATDYENEADILVEAIAEVTGTVKLPVVIATSNLDTIAKVLFNYSGIMAVKVLSDDEVIINSAKEIMKKYSAPFVTIDNKIVYC